MFIVVRRAMADMVKNTPAVMAAAVPTICAPLLIARAYCSIGLMARPMPKVKIINRATPTLL